MMTAKILLTIVYLVLLLALGSVCLFFPKRVQAYAIGATSIGITSRSPRLKTFIASKWYVADVRTVGLLTYVIGAVLAIAVYRGSLR
jgi:hypothetical protein